MGSDRQVLGRGLDQLLGKSTSVLESSKNLNNRILKVGIERIQPDPHQPRKFFDEHALEELAASIKEQGLIQPIVVSQKPDGKFLIIAGERRWRAAQKLGWNQVSVIVREDEGKKEQRALLALVENLQRENLSPIEEAHSFSWFLKKGWAQQKLAEKIGRDRSTIANTLRLLHLHEEVQKMLMQNKISLSMAKIILQEKSQERQKILARQAYYEKWTVRDLEKKIQEGLIKKKPSILTRKQPSWVKEGCHRLAKRWNLDVKLVEGKGKISKIVISFSDPQQIKDFVDHV